ncbi:MAG: hypothetical protein U0U09_19515 [Cyclobacteriaceae bacterium]
MSFKQNLLNHFKPALVIAIIGQLLLILLNWSVTQFEQDFRAVNFFVANLILLAAIVVFYRRTTIFNVGWTILSVMLTIGAGFCEFSILSVFEDSPLFKTRIVIQICLMPLFSFLLALNKVILDEMFLTFGAKQRNLK